MTTYRSRVVVAAIAALIACASAPTSHALLIDAFSLGQTNEFPSVTYPSFSAVDDAGAGGILGEERELEVGRTTGSGTINGQITSGEIQHSENGNGDGWSVLTWDGDGDAGAQGVDIGGANGLSGGGAGIDFTEAGSQFSIAIRINQLDWPTDFTLTLYDTSGVSDSVLVTRNAQVLPGSPVDVYFYYANFNPGLNMTSIDAVRLEIDPQIAGSDIRLEFIQTSNEQETVPEPGTLALMAVLGGVGAVSRLRRKKTTTAQ